MPSFYANSCHSFMKQFFSLSSLFLLECSSFGLCRYMGFPLIDQPSTDISRYFYIASKFIENGINSGGEEAQQTEKSSTKAETFFLFVSFVQQEKFSFTAWWGWVVRQHAHSPIWWLCAKCQQPRPSGRFECTEIFIPTRASCNSWRISITSFVESACTIDRASPGSRQCHENPEKVFPFFFFIFHASSARLQRH